MLSAILTMLSEMSFSDYTFLSGIIIAGITTIVQNASKKYKPWDWVLEQIGKAINKSTLVKLEQVEKKIEKLEEHDIKQDAAIELDRVCDARRRILTFADEVKNRVKHSEESFNSVLEDISFYKRYCKSHEDFANEKAGASIDVIEEIYKDCLRNGGFL